MKYSNRIKGYHFSKYVTKVFETPSEEYSEWFGYYNYDTLSSDQSKMLCNRISKDGSAPKHGDQIEVGYYDIPQGVWHHIGYSDSWNWQQGAMLQWIPGKNNENKVIYNCSHDGHLISLYCDISSGESHIINWPIYALTPDGKKSISLDLERSFWCRAYHYQSIENELKSGRVYFDDGIFEIDLINNTRRRIISIQDIIACDYRPYFDNRKHWIEHIMISPSGTRFCFLHRFSSTDNVMDYETRLMIADIDGSNLQCIPGWNEVKWSHFGWCGDDSFAIYTYYPGRFKECQSIKKVFHDKPFSIEMMVKSIWFRCVDHLPRYLSKRLGGSYSCYQFYSILETGQFQLQSALDTRETRIDGHPSFTVDKTFMLTDTYGDKSSWQHLFVYNLKTHRALNLAHFYAYYNKKPSSCDLHPKLCKDNQFIVVDTAYNARHHMILLRIDWKSIIIQ